KNLWGSNLRCVVQKSSEASATLLGSLKTGNDLSGAWSNFLDSGAAFTWVSLLLAYLLCTVMLYTAGLRFALRKTDEINELKSFWFGAAEVRYLASVLFIYFVCILVLAAGIGIMWLGMQIERATSLTSAVAAVVIVAEIALGLFVLWFSVRT